jgi:hypothetical protein
VAEQESTTSPFSLLLSILLLVPVSYKGITGGCYPLDGGSIPSTGANFSSLMADAGSNPAPAPNGESRVGTMV